MIIIRRNQTNFEIPLREIRVGDEVATFNHETLQQTYEPIIVKLNHENDVNVAPVQVLIFSSENQNGKLELSPTHYVYVRKASS